MEYPLPTAPEKTRHFYELVCRLNKTLKAQNECATVPGKGTYIRSQWVHFSIPEPRIKAPSSSEKFYRATSYRVL